jgi:serine O-acetyltransferase
VKLIGQTNDGLIELLMKQVGNIFPFDDTNLAKKLIYANLSEALSRLNTCINAVRMWKNDEFNYLHSSQYCIFLYYLSNTIWQNHGDKFGLCSRLFLLNKSLNGIDLFYEIKMPKHFFIAHSVGVVLAKAEYGDYLALHQNCTVGKNHGVAPEIGSGVVLYPNSAIIGASVIGSNSIVAQGASIINQITPGNSILYSSTGGRIVIEPLVIPVLQDIFRI